MTRPRTTLRKRAVLGGLLAALGAALLLPAAQALAPNELLLLVNARSPASRALANCYINPLFPTSGPATGSFIGLHAKSKFLAITPPFPPPPVRPPALSTAFTQKANS